MISTLIPAVGWAANQAQYSGTTDVTKRRAPILIFWLFLPSSFFHAVKKTETQPVQGFSQSFFSFALLQKNKAEGLN